MLSYLKHLGITILALIPISLIAALLLGTSLKYDRNPLVSTLHEEGPYIFYRGDSLLEVNYIEGNDKEGFAVQSNIFNQGEAINVKCNYPLDASSFQVNLNPEIVIPQATYDDGNKILAISDIESNYQTFRDFLIHNKVINSELDWIFGTGHLVLLGDFVDRGYFTTQVLWFIYKLEQDAKAVGGNVHFILGNHEIMNMQGDHRYARSKYNYISSILGKKQFELYGESSFIGRWLQSKNAMELINGHLFVHGGIHPKLPDLNLSIEEVNSFLRKQYYTNYFHSKDDTEKEQLLLSSSTSPYWFRGYFNKDFGQKELEKGLKHFNAEVVLVGHTIQDDVSRTYNGKLIGLDVKHPSDHYQYWPSRVSQGLLIENGQYLRLSGEGKREEI